MYDWGWDVVGDRSCGWMCGDCCCMWPFMWGCCCCMEGDRCRGDSTRGCTWSLLKVPAMDMGSRGLGPSPFGRATCGGEAIPQPLSPYCSTALLLKGESAGKKDRAAGWLGVGAGGARPAVCPGRSREVGCKKLGSCPGCCAWGLARAVC